MKTLLILADWAEQINGKLYIQGAEWSHTAADIPVTFALAVIVRVPWTQTNRKHQLLITLTDDDGNAIGDPPVRIEGDFELGRPPGTRAGTDLSFCAGFKFAGMVFAEGRYTFSMAIDRQEVDSVSFETVKGGTR